MKDWQRIPEVRQLGLKYAELYENTLHALSFTDRGSEESKALGVQAHFYLEVARDLGVDVVFKTKDYEEESEDARYDDS